MLLCIFFTNPDFFALADLNSYQDFAKFKAVQ